MVVLPITLSERNLVMHPWTTVNVGADLERGLAELKQRAGKAEQRLDDLESLVSSFRIRLDKVQSQLSGERQLRKVVPAPVNSSERKWRWYIGLGRCWKDRIVLKQRF